MGAQHSRKKHLSGENNDSSPCSGLDISRPESDFSQEKAKKKRSKRVLRLPRMRRRRDSSQKQIIVTDGPDNEIGPADLEINSTLDKHRLSVPVDPAVMAAGVASHWREGSLKDSQLREKNSNLAHDKDEKGKNKRQLVPNDSGGSGSSVEELTQEFLFQIIRCFPFPSPRPSPRNSPRPSQKNLLRRRSDTAALRHQKNKPTQQSGPDQHRSFSVRRPFNNILWSSERKRDSSACSNENETTGESSRTMETLKEMVLNSVDTMAITALPLDCWLRERLKHWVQLSGHQGTIMPATDFTLWKKTSGPGCKEAASYRKMMYDVICPFVPQFKKEVEYKGEMFIEIQDLTRNFENPAIMDIKIGTRTFLESEVKNPVKRTDLYEKMMKIDPSEPTEEEHQDQALTKLRYMQFREHESSTATLGFRAEAMKIMDVLNKFLGAKAKQLRPPIIKRLKNIRCMVEQSEFFKTHQVIGSSLLFIYDDKHASVWLIDFAKALPVDDGLTINHRSPWTLGNHEDGYLTGIDNLIQIFEDSKHKELPKHH